MSARRRLPHRKVFYGAVVTFNDRCSTMECVVRNYSDDGARPELVVNDLLPDRVALTIKRKGREFAAQAAWRGEFEAGIAFVHGTAASFVVPFD